MSPDKKDMEARQEAEEILAAAETAAPAPKKPAAQRGLLSVKNAIGVRTWVYFAKYVPALCDFLASCANVSDASGLTNAGLSPCFAALASR